MYNYSKNKIKKHSKKNWMLLLTLVLVVASGSFLWFRHTHNKPKVTQSEVGTATSDPNVPTPSDTNNATGGVSNSKDSGSNEVGARPSSDTRPRTPTGNFVSAHHNVPLNAPMNSVCTTTPGVTCQIRFTAGSIVKTLLKQRTNSDGSTLWDWTPAKIGLTAGTWKVTAIATNGDKMASAADASPLVIQ